MKGSPTAFSPISSEDNAGALWVVAIVGLIYPLLSALARIKIKTGAYGWDDYLLGLATVLHVGQTAVIFHGLHHGLAKYNSITQEQEWREAGKAFFTSEILSVLVLTLAKCSNNALIIRVLTFERDQGWRMCSIMQLLNTLWGVISIIALSVNCHAGLILSRLAQCPNQYLRWQFITVFDVLTDVMASLCPVYLMWRLNMPTKTKLQVFVAFSSRLLLAGLSCVHLSRLSIYLSSSEPQFAVATFVITQQAMLASSLVSTTIPNLRGFLKSFSASFGVPMRRGAELEAYPSQCGLALQTIGGSRVIGPSRRGNQAVIVKGRSEVYDGSTNHALRPDAALHYTTIFSDAGSQTTHEVGDDRNNSRELIIIKDVAWDVQHESL